MATWPESSSKTVDLIESTCFAFIKSDTPMFKTGIKAGKTGQEILEEYQPWKKTIEEIDLALISENTIQKGGGGDAAAEKTSAAKEQEPLQQEQVLLTAVQEGEMALSKVTEDWLAVVGRVIAKHINLVPWPEFSTAVPLNS